MHYAALVDSACVHHVMPSCTNQCTIRGNGELGATECIVAKNILQRYHLSFAGSYEANGTEANTPAKDYWYLSFGYTSDSGLDEQIINVALTPNGSVDITHTAQPDLIRATTLLQPVLAFAKTQSTSIVNVWKLLNALFVGWYWFVLADLGQISPTTYANSSTYLRPSDFSLPVSYPSTNNILLNTGLSKDVFFDIGLNGSAVALSSFEILTTLNGSANPDAEGNPKIRRIYLCNVREVKGILSLLVSVLGLGFSLMGTFWRGGMFILTRIPSLTAGDPQILMNQTQTEDSLSMEGSVEILRPAGDLELNTIRATSPCLDAEEGRECDAQRPLVRDQEINT